MSAYTDRTSWGEEIALLVLTYSKLEHYLPAVRANLDLFWPDRPQTFYATDGIASGVDIFNFKKVSFLELLSAAIISLVKVRPNTTHVILMLEDLCPLATVDNKKFCHAYHILRSNNKKYLTAQWPVHDGYIWNRDNWRATVGSISEEGVVLTKIPIGWDAYNSLVVCLWDISYLTEVITQKTMIDKTDPWSFENYLEGQDNDHFILEDFWPTYNNGFMWGGDVNSKLLTRTYWTKSPLLSELRRNYCGVDSLRLCQLKRLYWRLSRLLRSNAGAYLDQTRD